MYRSYSMPITHDEASTWLNYRHLNVWSCVSNPACWGSANNHWLNTLLLQWTATLFGDVPWALRLPNVIAGIAYLYCALLFCTRYIQNNVLRFAGFVLLCAHVYLLDFFSLARGYGMMASGVMWAMYSMLRYIEKQEWRWLVMAAMSLTFAILSNFTALVPWMAVALCWLVWLIVQKKPDIILRHFWIWLINAVFLVPVLIFPLKMLSKSGEFGWGSKNPFMMLIDLFVNLLYGASWFGNFTALIFLLFILLLIVVIVWQGLYRKSMPNRSQIIFMALLFITTIAVIQFNQVVTGSMAPIGRKSIFLIPLLFGIVVLSLAALENKKSGIVLGVVISLLVLWRI
ncbi:MAG: glycosyltransferase family 39 protein, partial [Saprospiraceae bacterium]